MPPSALSRATLGAALLTAIAAPSLSHAAPGFSASAVPIHQFSSDLDSGGEAGFSGLLASLAGRWPMGGGSSVGLALSLDYEDWHFDGLGAFGGSDPWDAVTRFGVSVPFTFVTEGGWRLGISPRVEYAGESGARFSDSLEYGATLTAARALREDFTLGLGVAVFERLEETSAFPFVAVDWRINERWRLTNPLPGGPSGPAGLEIRYQLGSDWELGLGGAYRSDRFRLDRDGPVPGGIGEHRSVPVLASIGRRFGEGLNLRLYAGVSLASQLRVEDDDGRRVYSEDRDPAPMVGLLASGRF